MKSARPHNRSIAAAWSVILVACSTGCMMQPGQGETYGSRDSEIDFMGASLAPGTRVEIQALHPTRGWERLAEVTAEMRYADHNGDWYIWFAEQRVPREYWTRGFYRYEAQLRAINLVDGQPVYTFERSFPWDSFVAPTGPEYLTMELAEMWIRWGHGTTVTIYAHDLHLLH